MRNVGKATELFGHAANTVLTSLLALPWLGSQIGRGMAVITYTGRRSGRVFQAPVAYRRTSDGITIAVASPDTKNWWRNFTGEGGPITIGLPGGERTGHAVAQRQTPRRVTVTIALDAPTS